MLIDWVAHLERVLSLLPISNSVTVTNFEFSYAATVTTATLPHQGEPLTGVRQMWVSETVPWRKRL